MLAAVMCVSKYVLHVFCLFLKFFFVLYVLILLLKPHTSEQ